MKAAANDGATLGPSPMAQPAVIAVKPYGSLLTPPAPGTEAADPRPAPRLHGVRE
jgi:hypothetical protein